ncbi:hypothetical protein C8R34_10459 [Nitrosomonas sp. Nm84]|uniref:hypothetical protein n=1 Tax=Nitrosomonas sp. Nm84 TaxID=200124 RepID=UPI000D759B2E|nr:hypothetical protein [Nitrosomonas sp. Nm84]PXW89659.1 hypothetical protein C8R34_10459 [Nitrosomonas sp. Nm84]
MNKLKVSLNNCYGIQSLDRDFDFGSNPNKPKIKVYASYALNRLMKTSFSRTFEALAKGDAQKEERYNRSSRYVVESDGNTVQPNATLSLDS